MKRWLVLILFLSSVNLYAGLGDVKIVGDDTIGDTLEYFYVGSTNTTSITFTNTSLEIYVIKLSTAQAWVNWTGSTVLTSSLTSYFLLPETDTSNAYETRQSIQSNHMAVYSTDTGVLPNIRIQIKSR